MKVRCIKTAMNKPEKRICNSDMTDYIKVGALFWVYGIEFSDNIVYIYIFQSGNLEHLIQVPLELFEVIDEKIPDIWRFHVRENGHVTLWPELFYEENFWENFSEFEKNERGKFKSLRELIEK